MNDYLLHESLKERGMNPAESSYCLSICNEYCKMLLLLREYDEGELDSADDSLEGEFYMPKKDVALLVVEGLREFLRNRGEKVDVFGVLMTGTPDNFFSAFDLVMQNYGGTDLYPKPEDKLANLFYFLIKNHYFADGNKRIASILLLWIMEMNNMILQGRFERTLSCGTVYGIAISVAESEAKDREIVVRFLSNIISTWKYQNPLPQFMGLSQEFAQQQP